MIPGPANSRKPRRREFPRTYGSTIITPDVRIYFTPVVTEFLKSFQKFEQQEIITGIQTQLKHEPAVETRNRKKLRANEVAEWEVRVGRFRVFYNVDGFDHGIERDSNKQF